ncbi:class I SAM-dependent methyltransferase [soil metagenome]
MSEEDRSRWEARHTDASGDDTPTPPLVLGPLAQHFPTSGRALDLACGRGQASVWLARRGMTVWGVDVSPVAVERATRLAVEYGVTDRCRFTVWDLDQGLPEGPPVDLLLCHMFRDPELDEALMLRLAPGGLLAVAVLSEVGGKAGPFRAAPGELRAAFGALDVLSDGEEGGRAWILAHADVPS